jgi:hypothetical protein
MLDDIAVVSDTSLRPINTTQGAEAKDQLKELLLPSPVEITGSDSRGNLVDLQRDDDALSVKERSPTAEDQTIEMPQTPTSTLRPNTAGSDVNILSTPRRGRRSAAPSPDSALVENDSVRSITPEPARTNTAQPNELPTGLDDLNLAEPSDTESPFISAPTRAEGFVQLGAPVAVDTSSSKGAGFPAIAASSVLEDEGSLLKAPPTFLRALVVSCRARSARSDYSI